MAFPESLLTRQQEGRIAEDQWICESTGQKAKSEKVQVKDMDSCEEAEEVTV